MVGPVKVVKHSSKNKDSECLNDIDKKRPAGYS